jgi:hypothetical protein
VVDEARSVRFERGSRDLDRAPFDLGKPDRNLCAGNAGARRDERRRVLARVAEHEVGLPIGDDGFHCREHCRRCKPAEELPIAEDRGLRGRRDGKLLADGRDLVLTRLASGHKRVACVGHHACERGGTDHEDLVTARARSVEQREQRLEMTGTTQRARGEHPSLHCDGLRYLGSSRSMFQ